MLNTGIYRIRNTLNGCVYIGSTNDFAKRKKQHFAELQSGRHVNKRLQTEYNQYGSDKFVFDIIEYTLASTRLKREQYWINHYKQHGKIYNTGTANTREDTFNNRMRKILKALWREIKDSFL